MMEELLSKLLKIFSTSQPCLYGTSCVSREFVTGLFSPLLGGSPPRAYMLKWMCRRNLFCTSLMISQLILNTPSHLLFCVHSPKFCSQSTRDCIVATPRNCPLPFTLRRQFPRLPVEEVDRVLVLRVVERLVQLLVPVLRARPQPVLNRLRSS